MSSHRATVLHRLSNTIMTSFTSSATLYMCVIIPLSSTSSTLTYLKKLIPTNIEDMRERAYINLSGAAINSNKTAGFFKLNAPQYTSHFKHNRALSILPIHANFNSAKYKTKKPVPANNTYVSIEGFLESVETDSAGHACSFHVSVDNINFLGRATISPSAPPITGITFHALSITVLISFLQ